MIVGNLKSVEQFRFWAHKIIPLVYDESLSYYEFLCKVVAKLNEVIEAVDGQNEHIQEFEQAITVLVEQYRNDLEGELKDLKNGITHEWAKNTDYAVNDYVWYESKIKQCTESHTSGEEYDGTKWRDYPVVDWVKDEVARLEDLIANGSGNAVDRFESPVISHYKGEVTKTAEQSGSHMMYKVLDGLSIDNDRRYFIMFKSVFYPTKILLHYWTEYAGIDNEGTIKRLDAVSPYNNDGVFFGLIDFNIPDSFNGFPIVGAELIIYDAPNTTTPYTVKYELFGVARTGSGSVTNASNKMFGSSDFGYMLGAIWATMDSARGDIEANAENITYLNSDISHLESADDKLVKSKTGMFKPCTDTDPCEVRAIDTNGALDVTSGAYKYYEVYEDTEHAGERTYLALLYNPTLVSDLVVYSDDAYTTLIDTDAFRAVGTNKWQIATVTANVSNKYIYLRTDSANTATFSALYLFDITNMPAGESELGVLPMGVAMKALEVALLTKVNSNDVENIAVKTQAQYDAMTAHDSHTMYVIVG